MTLRVYIFLCLTLGQLGLASAGMTPPVSAQPRVRVMGSAGIEARIGAPHDLQIALRDELGVPLPERDLRLELLTSAGEPLAAWRMPTDGRGVVRPTLDPHASPARLRISFAGDAHHPPAQREIDLLHPQDPLEIELPPLPVVIDLDAALAPILIQLRSPTHATGASAQLRDHRTAPVGSGRADAQGSLRIDLDAAQLDVGVFRWSLEVTAGDHLPAVHRELPVVVRATPQLALESLEEDAETGRRILHGRLSTPSGPLAGKAVGLYDADRHLTTVLTGPDGEIGVTFAASQLPRSLQARFESDVPWLKDARSTTLRVHNDHSALHLLWVVVPLLLGYLGLRRSWGSRSRTDRPLMPRTLLRRHPPADVPGEGLRDLALDSFQSVASELLGGAATRDLTPREVLAQLRLRRCATDAVEALAAEVERFCFGPEPPNRAQLDAIAQRASELTGQVKGELHGQSVLGAPGKPR